MELAEKRMEWAQKYTYPPSHLIEERATWESLSTRRRDALAALERSPVPETWSAPTIPKRLFQRIALGNPVLAAEMMARSPRVTVTEPDEGDDA